MKRQHYTNEEKETLLFRYASEQTDVQDLLQEAGIPKSTFNQWLREYDAKHNCQNESDYSPRNFRHLKARKMAAVLRKRGVVVSTRLVRELMAEMGLI